MLAGPAVAQSWGGGFGVASDKVVRGLSQTGARPSLLLDLFYLVDNGWAISASGASLPWAEHQTAAEWTLSVARSWQLDDDWASQLSATHYGYPGKPDARYRPYDELSASIAWRGRFSLLASVAPHNTGQGRDGLAVHGTSAWFEAAAHAPLQGRWSLDAGLGWHDNKGIGGTPYPYGSLGTSWGQGPLQLSLTWITSRANERGRVPVRIAGNRWVGAAWWSW